VGRPVALDPNAILDWAGEHRRDLPWRSTRDPWAILVAEIMLQQTQTDRVIPRWTAFCATYADPGACAAAPLGDVLRAWQGLGYPRRARDLHGAATRIVECHRGAVPASVADLLALPGVGPYTARAVAAFAFEQDVAVVETNIARVLARVAGSRQSRTQAQALADSLVPAGAGWAWNQGLMDLGATVCRPVPRCGECPAAGGCRWHRRGHRDPDPAIGSAGVSRTQARYEGSARQARGRVLAALAVGPIRVSEHDRTVVDSLVADRLVVRSGDVLVLP
jgi:A/G-specific adenine glycosylase